MLNLKSAIRWVHNTHNIPAPMAGPKDMCETCGRKPKFVENGFQHPYCGRSCARGGQVPKPPPPRPSPPKLCSQCNSQARAVGSLCANCDRKARSVPRIRELNLSGPTFDSVATQFRSQWQQGRAPTVEKILEISPSWDGQSRFTNLRKQIDATEYLRELTTYYSSQCICDMGVNDTTFCSWASCGICMTVRSSFSTFAFGAKHNTGRYGDGVYTYLDSSMADKWATSSTSSPYRVMLACEVVVSATNDLQQVADGPRVFVANSDAILPRFAILYKF